MVGRRFDHSLPCVRNHAGQARKERMAQARWLDRPASPRTGCERVPLPMSIDRNVDVRHLHDRLARSAEKSISSSAISRAEVRSKVAIGIYQPSPDCVQAESGDRRRRLLCQIATKCIFEEPTESDTTLSGTPFRISEERFRQRHSGPHVNKNSHKRCEVHQYSRRPTTPLPGSLMRPVTSHRSRLTSQVQILAPARNEPPRLSARRSAS